MNRIAVWIRSFGILIALTAGFSGCSSSSESPRVSPVDSSTPLSSRSASQTGRFSIVLGQYAQQDRAQRAQALDEKARQILKTNDIWLHNDPEGLMVNYGRFEKDTPESPIQNELKRVRKLYPALKAGPYQFCYIREIPSPDPPAPEEWNLLNNNCDYSVEIAAYYNVPEQEYYDRKVSAVEAVRKLRLESQDPAFFVHGLKESRIYIGCVSKTNAKSQIDAILRKYPRHYENGFEMIAVLKNKGKKIRTPDKSFSVDVRELKREVTF